MADQPTTLQGTSIMPSLTVNNLKESEKFFTALGFEIEDRWEDEGVLMGLMLKGGNARLGLCSGRWQEGHEPRQGRRRAHLHRG